MSEASKELTLANLGGTIRDRVRKVLFDSIPDATIQAMVERDSCPAKTRLPRLF